MQTPAPPARTDPHWFLATAIILGIIGYCTAAVIWGDEIRDAFLWPPCRLTTCAAPAMAAAGWLVPALLLASIVIVLALWPRLTQSGRVNAVLIAVAVGGLTYLFTPPDDTAQWAGPGGSAFATGLRWSMGAVFATLAAMVTLSAKRFDIPAERQRRRRPVLAAVLGLLALLVATTRAESRPMTAAGLFPGPFSVDGRRFTPVSAGDRDGCAGVVANEPLLRGCLRTVEVVVARDGQDARVHLSAVLFASRSQARSRWLDLPVGTGPQGVPGASRAETDVAGGWLLLTATEGRDTGDAARQVMVRFQRSQGDRGARYP